MMTFLSVITLLLALSAVGLMTYVHMRIFNRPYFGKEHSSQPDVVSQIKPKHIFVRHLEARHWWELWMGSFLVRFFSRENPEVRERKTFAHLFVPDEKFSKPYPLVIYTHGNGATIQEATAWLEHLVAAGYALLVCEYRGFGEAGGHPERSLINRDLCYFYDEALRTGYVDERRISVYGRSLGGGVACDLAARRPFQALILESSYFDIREILGTKHLPDYILLGKDFACGKVVETFQGKILLLHGQHDTVSPCSQSVKLKSANPAATLKVFDADHSNIYQKAEYKEYVLQWLKS
ncbi:MAG TPA: alpha/beta fold hydrolase [Bdellovibrionota bacterium]|jgi:pimeloyl-ACP methyl ester carboxylesterase|nr:alpha/beta fold hydrolase [Bdellovibrionota bacterium]